MGRPFAVIGLTVFFILSMLGSCGAGTVVVFFLVFIAGLVASFLIKSTREQKAVPVAFASAAVACLLLIGVNEFYYYPQLSLADNEYDIVATITSEGETRNGNYYYEGKTSLVDGEKVKVNLRIMFSDCPDLEPYDEISGKYKLYALGDGSDFSVESYKSENRFLGAYSADDGAKITNIPKSEKPLMYHIVMLRSSIKSRILELLPNDYGALSIALILGDRNYLSSSAYGSLKNCGITHIICVSGLHISLWSSAIFFVLKKLHIKEKIACVIDCVAIIFFMLLTGMTYSVMRAGIMMIIYLLSIIISRQRDSLNSLGFALMVISIINPYSALSLSLKLSAVSTLAIICYTEYVKPSLKVLREYDGAFPKILDTLFITFTVVLFNFPITLSTYGTFNLLVFPANMLAVFPAEICMILSFIGVLISALTMNIINIPTLISGICSKYIFWITSVISKLSFLNFNVGEKYAYLIAGALLFLAALYVIIYWSKEKARILSAVCCIFVILTVIPFYGIMQNRETVVTAFDVGDGTAVLVSKGKRNVLIGCGGTEFNGVSLITQSVAESGGNLDALVLLCDDDDCCGYMTELYDSVIPDNIFCDELPLGYDTLTEKSNSHTLYEKAEFGNIRVETFAVSDKINCSLVETNDGSFLICDCPDFDFSLLPEKFREASVIISRSDYPENISSDCIKALVICSENARGVAIQNELKEAGVNAYATAQCGNIIVRAKNNSILAERG